MAEIQQYKCPCCGGKLEFDIKLQKMKCPYCDNEYDVETLSSYDDILNSEGKDDIKWDTGVGAEWDEGEAEGLRVYTCNSCGGEIMGDETVGATSCPYCDSPVVMMGQFAGTLKPDLVIPFKLDKNAAIEALKKHYGKKKLLPKVFASQNHIEEVKGVYVPFWLFDGDASANVRYKATRTRLWSDSRYNYTETSFFSVFRGGTLGFEGIPVDGSAKMDDALMDSIEPFDLAEAVDFRTAYLSGYLADKYDVDAISSTPRANDRIKQSTVEAFRETVVGYDTAVPESTSVSVQNGKARYALFPVWLLNTTWNGKKYTFAMNGQTGKLVGDLPMDKGKYRAHFFIALAVSAAIVFGIQYLLWML